MAGGCRLPGAGIPCPCSYPRRSGADAPVNKTNVILCSATFYLYMNGKVLYL